MKLLTKILLINWHMFTCSEIEIDHNVLITGHNGAGKSTLLDAVQYVLTGGRTKFNLAANEDGARRLEGYVRGRLGMESQEYLRTGDVTTHIALEFYDEEEKQSFVLGAVIDLPEGGRCSEHFYGAYRTRAKRSLYMSTDNQVFSKRAFETSLKRSGIKYDFAQNKADAKRRITSTFGLNSKYTDLIPRALAFKPIGDLNDFMFRFLLPEDRVNIDALRENVRLYRGFEQTLQEQQERLAQLESIDALGKRMEDLDVSLRIASFMRGKIFVGQNEARLSEIRQKTGAGLRDLRLYEEKISFLRNRQEDIDQQIAGINSQIHTLDPGGQVPTLEERKRGLLRRFSDCQRWLTDFRERYAKDTESLHKLQIAAAQEIPAGNDPADPSLSLFLEHLEKRIGQLKEDNAHRRAEIQYDKNRAQESLDDVLGRVRTLEEKKHPYERNVQALIDVLTLELRKAAGREITVKPFCEYLEVTDERWRNALEGYLNTQRFDLFVDPAYFKAASRIYERFKAERGLYGVGIVDAGKLDESDAVPEGTLAEKVSAENIYARRYANLLLGRVFCEEDVERLNSYRQAITPSCMVYRNYTVRAINPAVYAKPFLGLRALELQLRAAKEELNERRAALQAVTRREKDAKDQRALLDAMDLSYIPAFAQNLQQYETTDEELQAVTRQLQELQSDPTWITLAGQKSELEAERTACSAQIGDTQAICARIQFNNARMEEEQEEIFGALESARSAEEEQREEMLDHLARIDREYEALQKKARHDFSRMQFQLDERRRKTESDIADTERCLQDEMHAFNVRTSFGFEENASAIGLYRQQYMKLRTVEIEKVRNQAIEARIKCEKSFQEDFISTLRGRIDQAKQNLRQLNRSLEDKDFQGDHYSFVVGASTDPIFSQYYSIICSGEDFQRNTIFMEELSDHNRHLMDELFARLVDTENSEKNERMLQEYTDYRKYMHYDIRITHADGNTTLFSRVNREKSGGETQTPFYVIIAASFDQLAQNRRGSSSGCLVLFDEAFNNMDENRIEALMKFYRLLNIQLMIAVPEGRVRNIMPYSETSLLLVKSGNRIASKTIIHETDIGRHS